jgi:hypothetical protein
LILLTACVAFAIQINNFEWNDEGLRTTIQFVEICFQGFVISVAALGLIRWVKRWFRPTAPRPRTLPGHMLAYVRVVILGVTVAKEWDIPWLGSAAWAGKMIDATHEIIFLIVIQCLTLPAIAWFRHRVRGNLGWHLVALALLLQSLVNLLMLCLSAAYHIKGIPWTLSVAGGLDNPISSIVQWSLVAASILFALIYERFRRDAEIDWLHTASAIAILAWTCLYIVIQVCFEILS